MKTFHDLRQKAVVVLKGTEERTLQSQCLVSKIHPFTRSNNFDGFKNFLSWSYAGAMDWCEAQSDPWVLSDSVTDQTWYWHNKQTFIMRIINYLKASVSFVSLVSRMSHCFQWQTFIARTHSWDLYSSELSLKYGSLISKQSLNRTRGGNLILFSPIIHSSMKERSFGAFNYLIISWNVLWHVPHQISDRSLWLWMWTFPLSAAAGGSSLSYRLTVKNNSKQKFEKVSFRLIIKMFFCLTKFLRWTMLKAQH